MYFKGQKDYKIRHAFFHSMIFLSARKAKAIKKKKISYAPCSGDDLVIHHVAGMLSED